MVRGPVTILTILVMKSVPQTRFRWIPCVLMRFLLSKTTMSVKLHFWWSLKDSVFWTVVQPLLVVALRLQRPCSPRVMNMTLELQKLIRLVVDHSTLEMGASSKATSLSRLPVRNDALGDFWIPVHLFVDQPKPTPLMLGVDFLKELRCVIDHGKDLIHFPMQSDCWWPLFVSSRCLYSMPLCGQHWEPSSQAQ